MQPLLDLHLQLKGFRYLQTTVKKKKKLNGQTEKQGENQPQPKDVAITNSEMEVSNSMLGCSPCILKDLPLTKRMAWINKQKATKSNKRNF
jgi:hypothetical protein